MSKGIIFDKEDGKNIRIAIDFEVKIPNKWNNESLGYFKEITNNLDKLWRIRRYEDGNLKTAIIEKDTNSIQSEEVKD